jgi:integrase/recombinase XerD
MSEKRNDINELDDRSRVLAALSWRASSPAPIAPEFGEGEAIADETAEGTDSIPGIAGESTALATVRAARTSPFARPLLARVLPFGQRAGPEDVLNVYLASRGSQKSRRTVLQGLERCARALQKDVRDVRWNELHLEECLAIRAALIEAKYQKATIDATLSALRGVMRQAMRLKLLTRAELEDAIDWDPVEGSAELAGRVLEREEITRLRTYCEAQGGAYGAFLLAAIGLLLGVGLRATEACTIPIAAYDAGSRAVHVRRKRNKFVALPVSQRIGAVLDAWLPLRRAMQHRFATDALLVRVQANDWVRPQTAQMTDRVLEYVLTGVARDAGLAHFTPHDLRRTFCTMLLAAGKDAITVAGLMSHEDTKTTMRYDRRGAEARAQAREDVEIW